MNVKAADKDLQFGTEKCRVMIVSKMKPYIFQKPDLTLQKTKIYNLPGIWVDTCQVPRAQAGSKLSSLYPLAA